MVGKMDTKEALTLDGRTLTPAAVVAVARHGRQVIVDETARKRVRDARDRVLDVVDSGEPVYGLNTGFGELVDERIPPEEIERLQTNLLRSHAAGAGRELSQTEVRAMLVCRINALLTGYSGVRELVVDHLVTLLNEGVQPVVRSRGSLGASGDLAPLAHLSLVLLGEGEAICHEDGGERVDGETALERAGLEPLSLKPKEGLALINGTQLTLGLGALFVVDAERLLRASDAAGALTTEVTLGTTATADAAIHDVRPHDGQRVTAARVRALTKDSDVVDAHRNCDRVQDAYSLRCLPQVHGATRDAISHLRAAIEVELNSATDNPLVFDAADVDDRASGTDQTAVLSGGNFHGQPLALRLEYARLALTDLGAIAERRIDRLLNPNLQEPHLPPFLAPESGVQSGYMIAQYTAASLLNECRSFGAASVDNTPVSGGQEDHVSMSAQAAFNAQRVLENVRRIVATEIVCATQAAEYIEHAFDEPVGKPEVALGEGTGSLYAGVRTLVPPLEEDRPLTDEISAVATAIESGAVDEWTGLEDAGTNGNP